MTLLLYKVPGIGKIIASVIAASVPDPSVFKSGRDFAAWLGLHTDEARLDLRKEFVHL
jgi:transposase